MDLIKPTVAVTTVFFAACYLDVVVNGSRSFTAFMLLVVKLAVNHVIGG